MALSRDEWYEHLTHGTGPLDPDAVETLAPEPELLDLLHTQIALPWPEFEEPEREDENDAPFYAMLLLGLLRDEASVPALLALASYSIDEDWEAVTEILPAVIGAIGAPALGPLLAEIDRMEREEFLDAAAIDRDGLDDTQLYRYWQLVICLEQVGLNAPETHPEIARFAAERIASHKHDRPRVDAPLPEDPDRFELPTPAEIWVDLQASLHIPELTPLVEDFFDRVGPYFESSIFGTREQYDLLFASDAPTGNARARVLATYRAMWDPDFEEGEDDDDVEDDGVDEEDEEDDDAEPIEPYVRPEPKVGRNDPCPCGSGKKYKKCHGA